MTRTVKLKRELEKIVRAGRHAQAQLDKINYKKNTKYNQKFVGNCYKSLNSYGGNEQWYVYYRIDSVDGDYARYTSVEVTYTHDVHIISTTSNINYFHAPPRIKISQNEFKAAFYTARTLALKLFARKVKFDD